MIDTTDIKALREVALKATAGEWCTDSQHSVIADAGLNANYYVAACSGPDSKINAKFISLANPATIRALIDQLEAERQRADENQAGSNTFKSIIGYIKDAQRNETFGLWKEASDRLNADGCNGTANHVIEYLEELNKAFESEAELAALKGDQVPVAWILERVITKPGHEGKVWRSIHYPEKPEAKAIDGVYKDVIVPLFTHPQKPVVSLNSSTVMSRAYVVKQIAAAGGMVKDGE